MLRAVYSFTGVLDSIACNETPYDDVCEIRIKVRNAPDLIDVFNGTNVSDPFLGKEVYGRIEIRDK